MPWDAWHPLEITERLRGVDVPWCVAAGWALDLFRGHATREHEDLEIAVPIGRFGPIRAALADFEVEVVGDTDAMSEFRCNQAAIVLAPQVSGCGHPMNRRPV